MKKLHLICGMCGCSEMLSFKIDPTGGCDNDGNEYPSVDIYCENCSTLTTLDEHIDEVKND